MENLLIEHYYIFSHFINNIPVYERTCGTKRHAEQRVNELKEWYGYSQAFYMYKELPLKYWY